MKKFVLLILLASFAASLLPAPTQAYLVPCGNQDGPTGTNVPCQFCHTFVLFNNIVTFLLVSKAGGAGSNAGFPVVLAIAGLMIMWGGFLYITSFGNPSNLARSREIFKATGIGLLIVYGAWAIVNTLTWFGILGAGWNIIDCPITTPTP